MDIEKVYKHYIEKLEEVDGYLNQHSSLNTDIIPAVTEYIVKSGGKRFRPLLTILAADLCQIDNNRHLKLAAAVEFIHTATLLHDDVVDESKMRRNQPTANNIWGNKAVILVGDYLFSKSFQLMVADGSMEVLKVLSDAANVISEGEVMQLAEVGNFNLTYDKYLQIIKCKTAELFAASCKISPLSTEKPNYKHVDIMNDIGLNLGIAFQIMDDVIDYSESPKMGKNQGDDFYEGKVTLPIILLKENASLDEIEKLETIFKNFDFTKSEFDYVYGLIKKYNILETSVKYAEEYIMHAKTLLSNFNTSFAKDSFIDILNFSLSRNF